MLSLIGDIGNTTTKICLVENKNFKIKKVIYFDSKKILSSFYLKKIIKKNIKNKKISNIKVVHKLKFNKIDPRKL